MDPIGKRHLLAAATGRIPRPRGHRPSSARCRFARAGAPHGVDRVSIKGRLLGLSRSCPRRSQRYVPCCAASVPWCRQGSLIGLIEHDDCRQQRPVRLVRSRLRMPVGPVPPCPDRPEQPAHPGRSGGVPTGCRTGAAPLRGDGALPGIAGIIGRSCRFQCRRVCGPRPVPRLRGVAVLCTALTTLPPRFPGCRPHTPAPCSGAFAGLPGAGRDAAPILSVLVGAPVACIAPVAPVAVRPCHARLKEIAHVPGQ